MSANDRFNNTKWNEEEIRKIRKYKGLKKELENIWKVKTNVIPEITGALGRTKPSLNYKSGSSRIQQQH